MSPGVIYVVVVVMTAHLVLILVFTAIVLPSVSCQQQYPTAAISQPASGNYAGTYLSGGSRFNTMNPTCAQDYTAVWTKSSIAPMYALSGGYDYAHEFTQMSTSSDGFNTQSFYQPPLTFPTTAVNRPHKGAALVQFAPPLNSVNSSGLWWTFFGQADLDSGFASVYYSYDNIQTWRRTVLGDAPQPYNWYFALATMPYTNYTVFVGGTDYYSTAAYGSNVVWYTNTAGNYFPPPPSSNATSNPNDDANPFTQLANGPFPPFILGNMVALFDNMFVPGSTSTNINSTLVLVVGNGVWFSTTGGYSWGNQTNVTAPWSVVTDPNFPGRQGAAMTVDADNYVCIKTQHITVA